VSCALERYVNTGEFHLLAEQTCIGWRTGEVAKGREALEGSQTSPRRLKLREATSGEPLYRALVLRRMFERLRSPYLDA
jgi:hypothetical protein